MEHFADFPWGRGDLGAASDQGTVLLTSWLSGRKPHIPAVLACCRSADVDIIVRSPVLEEVFGAEGSGFFEVRDFARTLEASRSGR